MFFVGGLLMYFSGSLIVVKILTLVTFSWRTVFLTFVLLFSLGGVMKSVAVQIFGAM